MVFIGLVAVVSFLIVFKPIRMGRNAREAIVPATFELAFPSPIAETEAEKEKALEEAKNLLAQEADLPGEEVSVTFPARDRIVVATKVADEEEFEGVGKDIVEALKKKWKGVQLIRRVAHFPERPAASLLGGTIRVYKPRPKVTLGLDLAGGVQLVLRCRYKPTMHEFTFEKPVAKAPEEMLRIEGEVREWLREKRIKGPDVEMNAPDRLIVRTETKRPSQRKWEAGIILAHLKERYGPVRHERTEVIRLDPGMVEQAKEVVRRRVDALGVAEAKVQRQGMDRVLIEIPGYTDPEEALRVLGKTALLEFRHIPKKYTPEVEMDEFGRERTYFADRRGNRVPEEAVYRESKLVLTGANLKPTAMASTDEIGSPIVQFELDLKGTRIFARFTRRHVGEFLGIFLDGRPVCVPQIEEAIPGGRGIIRGLESIEEATDLQVLLNAGALPIPLDVVENRSVSAMLGKDSVERSLKAGIIGFICIVAFMVIYYKLPGLLASVALLIYPLIVLTVLILVRAALTLPGIAGLILSLGMAVDANILIFERLKEELRGGKPLRTAIELGFNRAWAAIVDSNVTTLIVTFFLFLLGTGPIKGFAITLSVGILVSLFTAITVTRALLRVVAGTSFGRNPALYRT